jgi:PAS domain S-box-containing protein
MSPDEALRRRKQLLESLDSDSRFYHLFNYVDGLSFFAKDCDGTLLAANHHLVALYGFASEDELIGRTDYDLLPRQLAEKYRRDDLAIMESRRPVVNLVEIFLNPQGIPSWFLTTKAPIISRDGSVLGVMGIIQSYDQYRKKHPEHCDIQRAMDAMARGYREKISIQDLAESCGLSLRQFERKFKSYFNLTPQQFIIKMRINDACALLRDRSQSIGGIALDLGFYDQSSFTGQFKKAMGLTPLQYRKQFV